jgi:hypothetical protein
MTNGLKRRGDNYVAIVPVYDNDGELIAQVELLRRPEDAGWWTDRSNITNRGGP